MQKDRLSVRIEFERLDKLRKVARRRNKTITHLVKHWIDTLQVKPPSSTLKDEALSPFSSLTQSTQQWDPWAAARSIPQTRKSLI